MSIDWHGKESKWAQHIECGQDGCKEQAELVEDQGTGYCIYTCSVHGDFGVQFDDPEEDEYDPELDFGDEFDPYEDADE